jgi:hypothetical protein
MSKRGKSFLSVLITTPSNIHLIGEDAWALLDFEYVGYGWPSRWLSRLSRAH